MDLLKEFTSGNKLPARFIKAHKPALARRQIPDLLDDRAARQVSGYPGGKLFQSDIRGTSGSETEHDAIPAATSQ